MSKNNGGWRSCLKCDKSFRVKGRYRKICDPCTDKNTRVSISPYDPELHGGYLINDVELVNDNYTQQV